MRITFSRKTWGLLALIAAISVTTAYRCRKFTALRSVLAAGQLTPQPIQFPGFPFSATTIDGWVASGNLPDMRTHGWGLWAGLTAITASTNGLPTYETWYNATEVQNGPPTGVQSHAAAAVLSKFAALRARGLSTHQFEFPEQFHEKRAHSVRPNLTATGGVEDTDLHAQTLTTTMFSSDYAQSIWTNNYQKVTPPNSTVWNLQAKWGTITPVSQRVIKPFTPPSISLKPVYQFVNGPKHSGGITVLKYWLGDLTTGPTNSTNPAYPDPSTWNQCVTVTTGPNPIIPNNLVCYGTTTPPSGTVPVTNFYNYVITAAEATQACAEFTGNGFTGKCDLQAGDYAVLVAMHVSTKENSNWTWQSFWFNYNQPFPYGAPTSSVLAPFSNYAMCTGYSMTTNPPNSPKGTNTQCYNPYLETGLAAPVQGVNSNCMSCHAVASIGNNPNSQGNVIPANSFGYATFASGTAYISPYNSADDKAFFDCQTTTDFSWFLANAVGSGPSTQPTCVLTSAVKPPSHKK